MSKEPNEVTDLRCVVISLSDELGVGAEDVISLVHRLDA